MDNPAQQAKPTVGLLSIGEFADATGLSISAVRFYTNRGVLHPADVDAQTGYRRFTAAQVSDGRLISVLRRMEMPLASIAEALEMTTDERHELVQRHVARLEADVSRVQSIAQTLGATPTPKDNRPMTAPNDSVTYNHGSATLPARALRAALAQVLPATGTDPESPHLMTLLFEAKDGSLRIVGTDRHRLAVRDLVPTTIDADFAVVIAAATAASWPLDVDEELTISVTEGGVSLSGAIEATATAVPTAYPDYQSVLDTPAGATTVTTQAPELGAALVEERDPVLLDISPAGFGIGGHELVATVHAGPSQQVLVDPAYLRDALAATVGTDVVIDITTPLAPLVIRSADDGTFTTLVMPIAPE